MKGQLARGAQGVDATAKVPPMHRRLRRALLIEQIGLQRFSGLLVWLLFIVVYALWIPDTFLTAATFKNILTAQVVAGILAIGVVWSTASGALDLSCAATLGLCSTIAAALMGKSGMPVVPAIVLTMLVACLIGVANGVLVVYLGIDSIVVTLGMSSVLLAANLKITESQFISGIPSSFVDLTGGEVFGIPTEVVFLFVLALAGWYVLERTPFGRRLYATGASEVAARLAGVNTRLYQFAGLVACAMFGGLAGLVSLSQIGTGSPNVGPPFLLPVFAAAFLGATQIQPGRFNVWGTMLAIYLLATGVKGLQLAGGQEYITPLFNGLALILAVGVATLAKRRSGARQRARRQAEQLVEAEANPPARPPE